MPGTRHGDASSADKPSDGASYAGATLFLAVSLVFGTAFPAIEVGLTALPPLSFAAARYALSAVLLLGYATVPAEVRHCGPSRWLLRARQDLTTVAPGGGTSGRPGSRDEQ